VSRTLPFGITCMSHAMHNVGLPCFAISVSQPRSKGPDIQRHATVSKLVLSLTT
jgi:hypothetical protein